MLQNMVQNSSDFDLWNRSVPADVAQIDDGYFARTPNDPIASFSTQEQQVNSQCSTCRVF